jgi:hypothetical protein
VQHWLKLLEEIYINRRMMQERNAEDSVNLPLPFILPLSHWPTKRFPLGYKLVPSPHILSSDHEPITQAEYQMRITVNNLWDERDVF